jgi:hypothetical protein
LKIERKTKKKEGAQRYDFHPNVSGEVMLPNTTNIIIIAPSRLHQPGIEPGSVPWQGTILPLDHWCFDVQLMIMLLDI